MANELKLNLSGGMNTQVSPLIMKDSECELVVNYHLDKVGALTRRKGYTQYLTYPTNGGQVNGLYQFNDQSAGTGEQLMVSNNSAGTNGVIYYNNAGTWTAAKSNDTASKKSRFVSFIDYVFRVNGADVVATSTDGVTWGTTNAPATITPFYASVFADRVYLANGGTSTASRFWYSSLPSSGSITWDTANNYVDVNPDDGDQITALENNGNRLLIFKNRALYRWVFGATEPDRLIGVGTSSQESVKTNLDLGITFFANPNGVYAYTGARPKLISRKINNYIEAVSSWSNVYAEIDSDHYYLYVGDLTVDGETISKAMLVYHISLDAWTIYSLAHAVTWMAKLMPTSPFENIYLGSTSNTFKFLDGTQDLTSDIAGHIISKEYLLKYPQRTNVTFIDIFSQIRQASRVAYDLDRSGEVIPLGAITDRISNFVPREQECNSIRLHISDSSKYQSIIEGFNFEHMPKEKRDQMTVKIKRK